MTQLVDQAASYASGAIHTVPPLGKALVVFGAALLAAALLAKPTAWVATGALVVAGVLVAARVAGISL
ncbi:MAG: hypothetical protein ACYCT1_08115 [Steroidobacteraceae bacterium]